MEETVTTAKSLTLPIAAALLVMGGAQFNAALAAGQSGSAALCENPRQMQGFKTCADVEKAEQEGAFVLYSPDVEQGTVKILEAFESAFPKIKTSYIRLQTGALYAKLMAERQAGSNLVDAVILSDVGLALDFQKRGGYAAYLSPEMAAYKPDYQSQPAGFWTWSSIIMAGIAYNPNFVTAEEAPKDWPELLDPKWTGELNMKSSNSGLQHLTWYELKQLYGEDFWEKFAKQKPRAFDSYVQQYDRLVNGEDLIVTNAQYSGYLEFKRKGAPVAFVPPKSGLPAGPEVLGVVSDAPHPQAARLFVDWLLSPVGQKVSADALLYYSARDDVAPPEGGVPIGELHLLFPADWSAYVGSRREFLRDMNAITGLR